MDEMRKRLAKFDSLDWMGLYIVAGGFGFILIVCFWWFVGHYPIWHFPDKANKLEPGTFGDSFGFINSLFSCLAFAVAMTALAIQSSQSLKANRIAQETFRLQELAKFEDHRYIMLDGFGKLYNHLFTLDRDVRALHLVCFEHWLHHLRNEYAAIRPAPSDVDARRDQALDRFRKSQDQFFSNLAFVVLLFGNDKCGPLCDAIKAFGYIANDWSEEGQDVPQADTFTVELNKKREEVVNQITLLWNDATAQHLNQFSSQGPASAIAQKRGTLASVS